MLPFVTVLREGLEAVVFVGGVCDFFFHVDLTPKCKSHRFLLVNQLAQSRLLLSPGLSLD